MTQYQTTRHVEEALERLSEAYVSLGIIDEAQTAAAVLGHNFPDSPWYKDAYNLVKNAGGEPTTENKGSWISRAFQKIGLASAKRLTDDGRQRIRESGVDIPQSSPDLPVNLSSVTRCWLAFQSATSS